MEKEEIFNVLGEKYHFGKGEGGKNIYYLDNIHPCVILLLDLGELVYIDFVKVLSATEESLESIDWNLNLTIVDLGKRLPKLGQKKSKLENFLFFTNHLSNVD